MKVTLLGSTGLIGNHILELLKKDEGIESITAILRRQVNFNHPKVNAIVIDFNDKKAFQNAIEPDSVIFCAIGTTNSKVKGDREKYRSIDYDIPVNAAEFGLKKNCKTFVLVSSIGADSKSSNFYTKLKGEVEDKISGLGYENLHIFRPSLLLGNRKENRLGERIAKLFMTTFSFLMPSKYKPVPAKDVAKAMVKASHKEIKGKTIYDYKSILSLARG
jgi:uncharacterized protein YbjT (DUF2867 family)